MLLTSNREQFFTIMLLNESYILANCLQFLLKQELWLLSLNICIQAFLFFFNHPLLVDLLDLNTTSEVFKQHKLSQNDQLIGVQDVISCLTTIYSGLEEKHKDMVNVPLCVDMSLNWLLNVYDR